MSRSHGWSPPGPVTSIMALPSQPCVREGAAETTHDISIDVIKVATGKFDLHTVYNLHLSNRGLQVRKTT